MKKRSAVLIDFIIFSNQNSQLRQKNWHVMNDPKYRGAHATTESTSTCLSPSVRNSSVNVHKSEKDVNYCWMFIGVTTPFWWANEQNKSCKEKKMKEGRCMMILIHDASIQFPITCDCCQLTNPKMRSWWMNGYGSTIVTLLSFQLRALFSSDSFIFHAMNHECV